MLDYGDLEDDLVTRIGTLITDIDGATVIPMPETEEEFERGIDPKIIVAYNHSKFDDPKRMGGISQEEHMFFDIVLRSQTLRGGTGLYLMSRKLRAGLLGYMPINSTDVVFVENGRSMSDADFSDGIWTHTLLIKFKSYAIQVEDAITEPPLTQAKIKSNDGVFVVPDDILPVEPLPEP